MRLHSKWREAEENMQNDSTMKEKAEVLNNDRRVADERRASTYHQHAINDADEIGGRFKIANETTVIGATSLNYPAGPSWTVDPVPAEPPLNFDVNALAPCGEPHGVAASIAEQHVSPPGPSHLSGAQGFTGGPVVAPSPKPPGSMSKRAGSPSFSKNKRR